MAQMRPEDLSDCSGEREPTASERWFYDTAREELSDEWVVIYSTPLLGHRTKARGEIDFVLIGPPGVFVIEVKGGTVRRKAERRWDFSGQHGSRGASEGPWEQVDGNVRALRDALGKVHSLKMDSVLIGSGVCLPGSRFRREFSSSGAAETDVNLATLYDFDDKSRGRKISSYVHDLDDHWRGRTPRKETRLSQEARSRLLRAMWPDTVEAPEVLGADAIFVKEHLERLTTEQERILNAYRYNDRVVVEGGAGTGKTVLARREAIRLAGEAGPGERILFTCFNKNLAEELRHRLVASAPEIRVQHFHGVLEEAIRTAGLGEVLDSAVPPPGARQGEMRAHLERYFPELGLRALQKLAAVEGRRQADMLIVDEGQDLLSVDFVLALDALVTGGLAEGRWRLFLDRNQDLFQRFDEEGLRLFEAPVPARAVLDINCRNTEQIASKTEMLSGVSWRKTLGVRGRSDVDIDWWTTGAQQAGLVMERLGFLLDQGFSPGAIVLLSPNKRVNSLAMAELDATGGLPAPIVELGSGAKLASAVRFSTVSGFKGLDADAVILMDVKDLQSDWQRGQVYVGMSRARTYLSVLLQDDSGGRNRRTLAALEADYRERD